MAPMNSAFMHCSQKTGQQLRLKEKKRKERENADAARLSAIQTYTKPLISHVKKKTNFVNFDQISQSYHIESLLIPTFLCKIKYSTELIKQ